MTLKYNAGHRQWYKSRVKLYEYYHHAKCDIYYIYSGNLITITSRVWEDRSIKVSSFFLMWVRRTLQFCLKSLWPGKHKAPSVKNQELKRSPF